MSCHFAPGEKKATFILLSCFFNYYSADLKTYCLVSKSYFFITCLGTFSHVCHSMSFVLLFHIALISCGWNCNALTAPPFKYNFHLKEHLMCVCLNQCVVLFTNKSLCWRWWSTFMLPSTTWQYHLFICAVIFLVNQQ